MNVGDVVPNNPFLSSVIRRNSMGMANFRVQQPDKLVYSAVRLGLLQVIPGFLGDIAADGGINYERVLVARL